MTPTKRLGTTAFTITLLTVVFAGSLQADPKGQEILDKLDKLATAPQDQFFVYDMTTYEEGKTPKLMTIAVTIKGTKWRRVEFTAPGDIKGTRMLVRSLTQMYIYLPAYKRVRRIASHVRDAGFMGSTYTYDEMAIVTYGEVFSCDLAQETETHYKLKCQRREGQEFHYASMEMDIKKDIHRPVEIRFFNEKGVKLKTDFRSKYKCKTEELCNPMDMKLVDHTRNDIYTSMTSREWKVNTGVKDSFFTKRSLQRGR
ncbi:MAG: outer membrane lipoprotein-sorting protein [Deltaproteobacteria bacterium]|nr:outer membrane lipoprotein-sorting protein [Deltaproteobacteria bacterium]